MQTKLSVIPTLAIATPLSLLVFLGLALVALAWFSLQPAWVRHRRARLARRPFPAAWRAILKRRVPYVRRMPADLQLQLKQRIQVFLAEKPFIGCAGLVVSEEMRVTIAALACLLILNRPTDYYPSLRQILLYPGAFVVDRVHDHGGGVLREERRALSGESWSQGQVVLSWQDTLEGAAVADDGRNVVIHEFAHQLDQEKGRASGAPLLARRADYRRWSRVMTAAYQELQAQSQRGEETLLGDYAASDPAEFFAVASEVFFEQPERMASEQPALYGELSGYYRIDPLSW